MAKLTKKVAAELVDAHVKYLAAKAALDEAEAHSKELRAKHKVRVPYGADVDVGGYRFRRTKKSTGRRFSLGAYLKAGHKITAAMKPHVGNPSMYDLWEIQAIDTDAPSIEALVEQRVAAGDRTGA